MILDVDSIPGYRILGVAASGGMGIVYRARNRDGRVVAIKTVSLPDAATVRALRREIQALSQCRHPGIVQILDEGLVENLPWVAMEFVEGLPLRATRKSWLDELPAGGPPSPKEGDEGRTLPGQPRHRSPIDVDETAVAGAGGPTATPAGRPPAPKRGPLPDRLLPRGLRLFARIAEALAYLHGEGFVHRDIKPANIMVRSPELPVLIDFGLWTRVRSERGREHLQDALVRGGTVGYMAPEQLLDDEIDPRADIYALGCILYEFLTGRPLFEAESVAALAMAHLRHEPPPLHHHLPYEVPRGLTRLLAGMLAKDVRRRVGYASDVAAELLRLAQAPAAPWGPTPRPYLYKPRLTGRDELLEHLAELLTQAEADRGGAVILTGDTGMGKTRLAGDVARDALARKMVVLAGSAKETTPHEPWGGMRPILQQLADLLLTGATACPRVETESWAALLSLFEPSFTPLADVQALGADQTLDMAPDVLFQALLTALERAAGRQAVALILDDVHQGDALTLRFFEWLLKGGRIRRHPIALVLTAATVRTPPRLARLLAHADVRRLDLRELGDAHVAAMVGDMLSMDPAPPHFSAYLARLSEGNPLFVQSYMQAAVESGLLSRDAQGHWVLDVDDDDEAASRDLYGRLPLPRQLVALLRRRLRLLPPTARTLGEVGALIGPSFSVELVGTLAELTDREVSAAVETLRNRGLVEAAGGDVVRFRHRQTRSILYADMERGRRRSLHRRLAGLLLERAAAGGDLRMGELAFHLEGGGDLAGAVEACSRAARQASARFANDLAADLYRQAIALGEKAGLGTARLRAELAVEILSRLGRNAEALRLLRQAVQQARDEGNPGARGYALMGLAAVLIDLGRLDEACRFGRRALQVMKEVDDQDLLATTEKILGNAYLMANDYRAAETCYRAALEHFREAGNRRGEGVTIGNLAIIAHDEGDLERARRLYRESIEIAREERDTVSEALGLDNLACLLSSEGRDSEAVGMLSRAITLAKRTGNVSTEATAQLHLAIALAALDRPRAALVAVDRSLELMRLSNMKGFEGTALVHKATVLRRSGAEPKFVLACLDRAEEHLEAAGDNLYLGSSEIERGFVAVSLGAAPTPEILAVEGRLARSSMTGGARKQLEDKLDQLRRAAEDLAAGRLDRLFRGEPVDDLPPAVRRRALGGGERAS